MVALVYGEDYDRAYNALLEVIEIAELRPICEFECQAIALDFGLHPNDIRILFRFRERYPDERRNRFLPPSIVQKILLLEGFYGEEAQTRTRALQASLYGEWVSS